MRTLTTLTPIRHLVYVLFCLCMISCDKPQAQTAIHILSIDQQKAAIEASLPSIDATASSIKSILNGTKAETEYSEEALMQYAELLYQHMAKLEDYLADESSKEWLNFSYSTLDLYEETLNLLAKIQAELEIYDESHDSVHDDIYKKINACVSLVEKWFTELFGEYYSVATISAQLDALQNKISSDDEDSLNEVNEISATITEQFTMLSVAYMNVLMTAINTNNGFLTAELTQKISDTHDSLKKNIAVLNDRIDNIEKRLATLEGEVADLMNRMQSITYIPNTEDGLAYVYYPNSDTSGATIKLDFLVSPKEVIHGLLENYKDVAYVKAMYAGETELIDLPILQCHGDENSGIFSVEAACDKLSVDFYNGTVQAKVLLYISDGNNERTSDFIDIVPQYDTSQADFTIGYITTDNKIADESYRFYYNPAISNTYIDGQGTLTYSSPVTKLWNHAFAGWERLVSVILPNSVESIEFNAFSNSTLEYITIPKNVRSIDDLAFSECLNLTKVTLPDNLKTIEWGAFVGCTNLSEINIPSSIEFIGESVFTQCFNLSRFDSELTSEDGRCLILNKKLCGFAPYGMPFSYALPEGIESIGASCFSLLVDVEEIILPDGIRHIGEGAFDQCTSLKSINLPNSLKSIDGFAFSECSDLASIDLPDGIEHIGENAFQCCNNLKSIVIPNSITTIEDGAFGGCKNLSNIILPENLSTIKTGAFTGCRITSIVIPSTVTSIGEAAFTDNPLKDVYCKAQTPPVAGTDIFNGTPPTIYVPNESVDEYKNAAKWRKFADHIVGYEFEQNQ